MTNIKIYQICHTLITYFVTLTSQKKDENDAPREIIESVKCQREKLCQIDLKCFERKKQAQYICLYATVIMWY